ncbi:MAG TPA: hypothetical protein VK524_34835 [Polyangiaceae bacterium]|nr:hypothetical protein [Polyangiaceae bacterium]
MRSSSFSRLLLVLSPVAVGLCPSVSLAQPQNPVDPAAAPPAVAQAPAQAPPAAADPAAPAPQIAEKPQRVPPIQEPDADAPGAPVPKPPAREVEAAPAPAPAAPDEADAAEEKAPEWTRHLTIGGGVILYYYQPLKKDWKNNFDVFFANLLLDAEWDRFGLHLEPRFRDTKLRPFFDGPVWLQEAYASVKFEPLTVKVGKTYKQFGLFWDNSFYGNVQVYDGLKLDPNYGISAEASLGEELGVDLWAQFFVVDGRSNVSLQGRDTLSVPGARRRNTVVGRAAPFYRFSKDSVLQVGLSAEHFEADFTANDDKVTRLAGDAKLTYEGLGVWAEVSHQSGRHVTDFPYAGDPTATPPVAGRASGDNTYVLAGAEYSYGPLTARYNFSLGRYADLSVRETMHVPAIGVRANDFLSVLGELVLWKRHTDEGDLDVDESVNITLNGHF